MRVLPNGIAVLDGDQCVSRWVEETGRLDHDRTLDLLAQYIPIGATVVDVGAYIGDHTISYARRAERVFAFEPNPAAFDCLQHNLKAHQNCQLFCMGLSDRPGNLCLREDASNPGASYLAQDGGRFVHLTTLDSLRLDALHYMKIDVEGHEPQVLDGAFGTLRRFRPVLFIEVNRGALLRAGSSSDALVRQLEALGYAVAPLGPIPHNCPQWDALCLPKGYA